MAINLPQSQKEIENRLRTDVQNELPNINPFLRNSFLSALIVGFSGRIFDFTLQQQQILNELFLDTATGTFLDRWGSYKAITRNPATKASGFMTASGTAGSTVTVGSQLATEDGVLYEVLTEATISDQSISVTSITRSGSTATVTTVSDHNLASGITVTISGADQTEYNLTSEIIVTGTDEFTYEVSGSPPTPATGTIIASFSTASVNIRSLDFGLASNLISGTKISFTSPIAGVDNDAFVQFTEITGGSDTEDDESFRVRVLDAYQNPFALFNVASIVAQAKKVNGVTRVFVEEVTPELGQVTVFFTRDNDVDIIPAGQEIQDVKDSLLLIKPAHMDDVDLIVSAPVGVNVNFVFTLLSPNTTTMKESVANSLTVFFRDGTTVGKDLKSFEYISAIANTIDSTTGEPLIDFILSTPTGDVSIADGELPILGTITF